jgi:hypothetical protein
MNGRKEVGPKVAPKRPRASHVPMLKAFAEHVSKPVSFREASPEEFISQRAKTKRPEFLSDLKAGDLGQHKLFLNKTVQWELPSIRMAIFRMCSITAEFKVPVLML